MPGPEHVEVATLLLDEARADLEAARALASDERQAWRYDEAPSPIDRERALRVAQSALDWAQDLVGPAPASRDR